jgi:hypothetical protein
MYGLHGNPRANIYVSPPGQAKDHTTLALKLWYNPLGANRSCSTPLHRTATPLPQTASSLTQALRSRHASAGIEASLRARIPSPPAEPPVLVLWLNQVTQRFSSEPPQTARANSGCEPLPYTGSHRQLVTMRPAVDHIGHRIPWVRPTCLSTSRRPHKA